MDIAKFKKLPVIGILRGAKPESIAPLTGAVISAGLETIEITMNTDNAHLQIREMVKEARSHLTVGAGTVLTMDELHSALDAGATFIVMPVLFREGVEYCVKNKIPVFPGALTPQEISNAWQAGATMVKVFPAKYFGPGYFKEIRGPFKDIQLLACSGVTPENMKDYFANGANAVSFGASIFKKEWMENKDFDSISRNVSSFIRNYFKILVDKSA
ncbi:MAG: bifunctional 4-hydroxy-2-oxoglutarate aldolase/2-dehydro-3-deoxy-phosphogluconate aldolase [Candidatus Omnitrophota bacterium]|jgi:2-dehydro-3-deoxyphosphogluconate aldolase/(4S)-4-hydroxy-2-oxoglutarate aldolase